MAISAAVIAVMRGLAGRDLAANVWARKPHTAGARTNSGLRGRLDEVSGAADRLNLTG